MKKVTISDGDASPRPPTTTRPKEEYRANGEDRYRYQSVLVTGGAGYLGSVLVRKLRGEGKRVIVLDSLLYGQQSLHGLEGRPMFELIRGDIRNGDAVLAALRKADAVVHLGALVGDRACNLDQVRTLEVNQSATLTLAQSAQELGIERFIFASSCSVYGHDERLLDEQSELSPVSLYARTKIACEEALPGLCKGAFSPVILRLATLYGLSFRPRFDLVINLLTAQAVCEKRLSIFGGSQWRPFVHVADAADAIILCLEAPTSKVAQQVFNVGGDQWNHRLAEIGDILREVIPDVQVDYKAEEMDPRNYRVSFAKIRERLSYVPRRTVADGILEIKAALEEGQIQDYTAPRYSNLLALSDPASV